MSTPSIDDLENMPEGSGGQTLENYEHHERHRLARAGLIELRDEVDNATGRRGARAVRSTNQALGNNSTTAISFDGVDFDDEGFWSSGSPTRLTVPTGVSRVRLKGGVRWASVSGTTERVALILLNGSLPSGGGFTAIPSVDGHETVQDAHTGTLNVVAGDYFQLLVRQRSGGTINVTWNWLEIEVVE